MPFQVGHPKYGGSRKGQPNKFSLKFVGVLEKNKFDIAQKAINMWNEIPEGNPLWYDVKLKILEFLAKYSLPRPTIDVNLDVQHSKPLDNYSTRELIEAIPTIETTNESKVYGARSD